MRAEVVSIGTEILLGEITDTNAAFIASHLPQYGIDLLWVSQVGDNPSRMNEVVQRAWDRSDIIFITGGLANVSNQDVAGWNFINRITWDISTIGRTLLQVVQNGQAIQGVSQQINSIPQSGRSVVVDSDAISTAVVEELSQRLQT